MVCCRRRITATPGRDAPASEPQEVEYECGQRDPKLGASGDGGPLELERSAPLLHHLSCRHARHLITTAGRTLSPAHLSLQHRPPGMTLQGSGSDDLLVAPTPRDRWGRLSSRHRVLTSPTNTLRAGALVEDLGGHLSDVHDAGGGTPRFVLGFYPALLANHPRATDHGAIEGDGNDKD